MTEKVFDLESLNISLTYLLRSSNGMDKICPQVWASCSPVTLKGKTLNETQTLTTYDREFHASACLRRSSCVESGILETT